MSSWQKYQKQHLKSQTQTKLSFTVQLTSQLSSIVPPGVSLPTSGMQSLMEGVCVGAADGHPLLLQIWLTCVREGDADSGACRALYFQVQHWGENPSLCVLTLTSPTSPNLILSPYSVQCLCLSSWVWLILKTYILHIAYDRFFQSKLCYCAISTL